MSKTLGVTLVLLALIAAPAWAQWGSMVAPMASGGQGAFLWVTLTGTAPETTAAMQVVMHSFDNTNIDCDSLELGSQISNSELTIPVIVEDDPTYGDYFYVYAKRDNTFPYNQFWAPFTNQPLVRARFHLVGPQNTTWPLDMADSTQPTGPTNLKSIYTTKAGFTKNPAITDGSIEILSHTLALALTPPGPYTVNEGQSLSISVVGTDSDPTHTMTLTANGGLQPWMTWTPPAPGQGTVTGTLVFNPGFCDDGNYSVTFTLSCTSPATITSTAPVTVNNVNRPPYDIVTSPGCPVTAVVNNAFHMDLTGKDLDVEQCGDDHLVMTASPGTWTFVDNGNGTADLDWVPTMNDTGCHDVVFTVTDASQGTYEEVCQICVVAYQPPDWGLTIKKVRAWPGEHHVCVPVFAYTDDYVGGFEVLLEYDQTVGTVVGVEYYDPYCDPVYAHYFGWPSCGSVGVPGDPGLQFNEYHPLFNSSWHPEYFNYVLGADGHVNWVRVVGIMDMEWPQTYQPPIPPGDQMLLFYLIVDVSPNWDGHEMWFRFRTNDCTDNTFSDSTGYYLWGPDKVCSRNYQVPTWLTCAGPRYSPVIYLFGNPGIGIRNVLSGDINCNDIAYEVGDAVLFVNYLIYGDVVLGQGGCSPEQQGYASDINGDGYPWTIADLVMLINIINGYQSPPPAPAFNSPSNTVEVSISNGQVTAKSEATMGGAYFVFKVNGEVSAPQLGPLAQGMTLASNCQNGELRVVLYSMDGTRINAGQGVLFTVPSQATLDQVQFSNASGYLMKVNVLPTNIDR